MECLICSSITLAVQVIFSLIFYLVVMGISLIVAVIDWTLAAFSKKHSS